MTKKKAVVTGGCGFIGSSLIDQLIKTKNYDVINIDKLTYAGNIKNIKSIENSFSYQFYEIDICNYDSIISALSNQEIDIIFHLAAESHVDRSIDKPSQFLKTNIMGTYNLLEFSRQVLKKRISENKFKFIHISTDEVYGDLDLSGESFSEFHRYAPSSPYSASKASSDHLVRAWNRTFNIPSIVCNCSNNYGPRQHVEKLIPKTISNIKQGKKIPVYGKGENIRDWIYVEDHCKAILDVYFGGEVGSKYNIGGECEVKNIDLVKNIINIMGASEDLIEYVDDRPGHDLRYAIDNAKIKSTVGFHPQHSIEEGLKKTIDWYLNYA